MAEPSPVQPPLPDFIQFLFSAKPKYNCYFIVGKKSIVKPERIGCLKTMMMAHSPVLRAGLEDSELAEKEDIPVEDIYPDTFRTLLKYVYGYDMVDSLKFDEADNLLYAAEKYLMTNLKKKLSLRLISLLTPENVCSLLNNPAVYIQLELNNAITKILRYETGRVLASSHFLEVSVEGLVKICEQDGLNVSEIELWRAAIKWAKHRAGSVDGKDLREQIIKPAKHLRICTLTSDQICKDVVTTNVLTGEEVKLVCNSLGKRQKQHNLTTFNNEILPRKILKQEKKLPREFRVTFRELFCLKGSSFSIHTKKSYIELLPLEIPYWSVGYSNVNCEPYEVVCDIMITYTELEGKETKSFSSFRLRFRVQIKDNRPIKVPLRMGDRNVTMAPNSLCCIHMMFMHPQLMWGSYLQLGPPKEENDHMSLHVNVIKHNERQCFALPTPVLMYKVTADPLK